MRATSMVRRRATQTEAHTDVQHVGAPASSSALRVGAHDDPAEAEADRLAAQALAVAADYQPVAAAVPGAIRRRALGARRGETAVDEAAIRRASAGGRSLDPGVRAAMEPGLGRDLAGVRVHTGPAAAEVARSIDAAAFTRGQDVYFGAGAYQPGTPGGDEVIAHELAHTVQHRVGADVQRYPATAMTLPVPWSQQTASVFRPGEGASGGVYILTTNIPGDPVQKAVAKPVFGHNAAGQRESGEQLVASDRVMAKLLGLNAPQSRVVRKGSTEFDELVKTCAPHQPQPQSEDEEFIPLAHAESFVVMSEVPNATSVGSLADKAAGGDRRATGDLYRTVFDDTFLSTLGRVCIGDMLLGNSDRMVMGAMNLGNVMLSMQDGRGAMHAIDTTAVLPKAIDPSEIASSGNTGGGMSMTVATHLDGGPGTLLDGFFDVLVERLKGGGGPAPSGVTPAWQIIESTYKTWRDRWVGSFEFGWNDAMITVMALADDGAAGQIDDAIGDARNDMVSTNALQVNAQYIGGRVMGSASHDEAVGRPLAMALANQARDVDKSTVVPPLDDELAATFDPPNKKALQATWTPVSTLPPMKQLMKVVIDFPRLDRDGVRAVANYPAAIGFAHAQVDQSVSPTKSKRSILGKKKTVVSKSNELGHAVVDAHAVIAGNGRVTHQLNQLRYTAEEMLRNLPAAKFTSSELGQVRSLLDFYAVAADHMALEVERYNTAVGKVAATVPSMNYPDKKAVSSAAGKALARVQKSREFYADIRKLKLQQVSAGLKASA